MLAYVRTITLLESHSLGRVARLVNTIPPNVTCNEYGLEEGFATILPSGIRTTDYQLIIYEKIHSTHI